MPDVSNFDLMKLICSVIKKVDIIEGKLDQLLDEKLQIKYTIPNIEALTEHDEVGPALVFSPIANVEDLNRVSRLLEQDERYTKNLVSEPLFKLF